MMQSPTGVPTYDAFTVPVDGGDLFVGRWTTDASAPVVLAVHGVTANHLTWALLARLSGLTIVAPDLRGRGASGTLPGPAGMAAHTADLVAVTDHLGQGTVDLVGHSMGGFVVAAFAAAHPERTGRVLLVDGGLPFPDPPEGVSTQDVVASMIGPAAQRLTMTFESREAYLDYWRPHPALAEHWSSAVEVYLEHDLVGEPPRMRSSVSLEAVTDDSRDLLEGPAVADRARSLPKGTIFLRAPYGLLAEPEGLYVRELVEEHRRAFAQLDFREIDDVNHYTILLTERGAAAVAEVLGEWSGQPG